MKYQIVINLTNFSDKYSIDSINAIYSKYNQKNKLTSDENDILNKIFCYVLLIIKNNEEDSRRKFVGKTIVTKSNCIDNIIESFDLSIQTIEEIKSNNNYVFPNPAQGLGLGNNLFRLLTVFNYANKNRKKIIISTKEKFYGLCPLLETIFDKIAKAKIYPEIVHREKKEFDYEQLPCHDKNCCYMGYYQNVKYVEDIMSDFFDIISFSKPTSTIKSSFFIHVRLGDYMLATNLINNVGLLENNYYSRAYEYFKTMNYTTIYVISDEMDKAIDILKFLPIDKNIIPIYDEINSFNIMMSCELGGICSNSTFSWWGAYLNKYFNNFTAKQFIFPKKWDNRMETNDIYFSGSTII